MWSEKEKKQAYLLKKIIGEVIANDKKVKEEINPKDINLALILMDELWDAFFKASKGKAESLFSVFPAIENQALRNFEVLLRRSDSGKKSLKTIYRHWKKDIISAIDNEINNNKELGEFDKRNLRKIILNNTSIFQYSENPKVDVESFSIDRYKDIWEIFYKSIHNLVDKKSLTEKEMFSEIELNFLNALRLYVFNYFSLPRDRYTEKDWSGLNEFVKKMTNFYDKFIEIKYSKIEKSFPSNQSDNIKSKMAKSFLQEERKLLEIIDSIEVYLNKNDREGFKDFKEQIFLIREVFDKHKPDNKVFFDKNYNKINIFEVQESIIANNEMKQFTFTMSEEKAIVLLGKQRDKFVEKILLGIYEQDARNKGITYKIDNKYSLDSLGLMFDIIAPDAYAERIKNVFIEETKKLFINITQVYPVIPEITINNFNDDLNTKIREVLLKQKMENTISQQLPRKKI